MDWKMSLLSLLFLVSVIFDISAGDDFDKCTVYKEIAENDYDKHPSSVNDLSRRPLGFQSAVIPFVTNNPNAENPCFQLSLSNSSSQTVEVLAISAVGSSSFCVKSQPPYSQPTCQSGIKTCSENAIGYDTIKFVFYCNNNCESDIQFWFRLTVSPSFTDGLHFESWCQREAKYPDSLIILPNQQITSTTPASKASLTTPSLIFHFWLSLSVSLAFLVIRGF